MTYPSPYPGPPQDPGGPQSSPYAPRVAYGQPPVSAPQAGAPYGQAPTPAGHGAYMPPEQLAIPTQSVHRSPGASVRPDHPYPSPSAQAPAPQYQPYQSYQQHYQQGANAGSMYLSGAVTAPGYSAGDRPLQPGYSHAGAVSPQTIGAGHHVPWRGEKAAALATLLTFSAVEIVNFIVVQANLPGHHDWFYTLSATLIYITITPSLWWLFFAFHHLFRNQPVSEMIGLALWFGLGTLTLTNGTTETSGSSQENIDNVVTVLSFIIAAVGVGITIRLNQKLKDPRSWIVTLAVGSCQFVLFNTVLRLTDIGWSTYTSLSNGRSVAHYTSNVWLMWSNSGGVGIPLAPSLAFSALIVILSGISFFQATRSSYDIIFRATSIAATSLLSLYNIIIFSAYGLPSRGGHSYKPSDTGTMLLAVFVIGTITVGSTLAAAHHLTHRGSTGANRRTAYSGGARGAQGIQNRFSQYHQPQPPIGGSY